MNKRHFTEEEVSLIQRMINDDKAIYVPFSKANYPTYGDMPIDYDFTYIVPFDTSWWRLTLNVKPSGLKTYSRDHKFVIKATEATEMRPQEKTIVLIEWVEV